MFKVNENFLELPSDYLFSTVGRRIADFLAANPGTPVIRMGIGDVTRPLCAKAIDALVKASREQASAETFRGYGPEQGYRFLTEKIAETDYRSRHIDIDCDDIFISDGAKSDIGNIGDILGAGNRIAVTDPVYPVYVDTNVMAGRAGHLLPDGHWSRIIYLPCTEQNGFCPELPDEIPDIIYLCYPNNPTGTALTRSQLKNWVDYARQNGCLILFDSAYEAYVCDNDVPHSIYEIDGSKEVAIEFRSFSKTAGFTGLRCGYTVVPKELYCKDGNGVKISLNRLWNRRQCTKFNGTAYVVQRAAEALYSAEGLRQVSDGIAYYMANATVLRKSLVETGLKVFGGVNAPYLWVKAPGSMSSWDFFDFMLDKLNIAVTPGVGFGPGGEGYVRLTAFSSHEDTAEAARRLLAIKTHL